MQKKKKRNKPQYIRVDGGNQGIPLHIIFTIFLIFAGGVGTAISFAQLDDMRRQINSRRNQVIQLRDDNAVIRNSLEAIGLEELARLASERLNMRSPTDDQVVNINVPIQANVYLGTDVGQEENIGIWRSALGYLRSWLSID